MVQSGRFELAMLGFFLQLRGPSLWKGGGGVHEVEPNSACLRPQQASLKVLDFLRRSLILDSRPLKVSNARFPREISDCSPCAPAEARGRVFFDVVWRARCGGTFRTHKRKAQKFRRTFRCIFREKSCASKKIFRANSILHSADMPT